MGRELIMKDNTHGYTDFHDLTTSVDTGIDKPEVVKESYVIDYTSATFDPLTMDEDGGFSYRWVYGLDKLSVKITSEGTNWWGQNVKEDILKDYLHQDRLGSTTNLTDQFGRVVGRADYNEWGEITYREALDITSSYRRIYPQSSYTGHDYDEVLNLYYAKARFYSAEDKRFVAMDPIKGNVTEPLSLVPYLYCVDNPLRWVDPSGESLIAIILITAASALVMGSVNAAMDARLQYVQHGSIDFTLTATKFVEGAVAGGLAASPAPGMAILVGVPIVSSISSIAYDARTNELGYTDYNIHEMGKHAIWSGAYSLVITGAGNYLTSGNIIADGSTRPMLQGETYTYMFNSKMPKHSYTPGIIHSSAIRGAVYAGGYSVVTTLAKGTFDSFTCKKDKAESSVPTGYSKPAEHDMPGSISSEKSSQPVQSQTNQKLASQSNRKLLSQSNQKLLSQSNQKLLSQSNRKLLSQSNQKLLSQSNQKLAPQITQKQGPQTRKTNQYIHRF